MYQIKKMILKTIVLISIWGASGGRYFRICLQLEIVMKFVEDVVHTYGLYLSEQ